MDHTRLEDWTRHTNATPYTAPECIVEWYQGKVFNHPNHEDGTYVVTTAVDDRSGNLIKTQNRIYTLGQPRFTQMHLQTP